MPSKPLLVRFRDKDSNEGVSRRTLKGVAATLGLSETEAIHRALVEYSQRHLPRYERDDGPLSEDAYQRIEEAVRRQHGNATIIESLFDEPVSSVKPSGRVSSSRSR